MIDTSRTLEPFLFIPVGYPLMYAWIRLTIGVSGELNLILRHSFIPHDVEWRPD